MSFFCVVYNWAKMIILVIGHYWCSGCLWCWNRPPKTHTYVNYERPQTIWPPTSPKGGGRRVKNCRIGILRNHIFRVAKIVAAWQPGCENMERYSLSSFAHFLFISSLSIHFLYTKLSHFVAKCYCECHKKMRYEKIILGRIHCEKVPQVVRACPYLWIYRRFLMNVKAPVGADK